MTARDVRAARVTGPPRRTYLPLERQRRKPTDYEVTTTGLLYYPARGFEVETPVWQHYVAYQRGSQLQGSSWDSFEDPAHFTYSSYVAQRRDQEVFLDKLFERPRRAPAPALLELLGPLSALRFPLHGLQMIAAYVGALAPGGRISVVAAFQAADELRRIQRLCQWLARAERPLAELDALGRELWQQAPAFQPLRRLVEELLVTFDWGEALVVLNGALKPALERLLFDELVEVARRHDDEVLEQTLRSLGEDGRWHAAWFEQLSRTLTDADAANQAAITRTLTRLVQPALDAVDSIRPLLLGTSRETA